MGFLSLIQYNKKPRKFNYTPRYYSPEIEKRNIREQRILNQIKNTNVNHSETNEYVSTIKGAFKVKKAKRLRIVHKQNIIIAFIFLVLLYLAYNFLLNFN